MKDLCRYLLVFGFAGWAFAAVGSAAEKEKKPKVVAGKADVMRHVKKVFATLVAADPAALEIRLRIEGEKEKTTWPVLPDAEVKVHGWWGRMEQLKVGDRIWVWMLVDRDKKPRTVLMVADEMSEQDIHGTPLTIRVADGGKMTVHVPEAEKNKVEERGLEVGDDYGGPRGAGEKAYLQSAGGVVRVALSPEGFEKLRGDQQEWLRRLWKKEGLPGAVTVLHPLGGEMDILLDHEAIRWGRYLKSGDKVTINTERPISGVVKMVRPWRERTMVRLVTTSGLDQLDLRAGQRIAVTVPEPPKEVQASTLPADIGRLEKKEERVDWFLSTIYCSCGIEGDRCTGMFYIQSSCNVNACGMPNEIARVIGGLIDDGLSDREVFIKLKDERGRDFWRPHLLR